MSRDIWLKRLHHDLYEQTFQKKLINEHRIAPMIFADNDEQQYANLSEATWRILRVAEEN